MDDVDERQRRRIDALHDSPCGREPVDVTVDLVIRARSNRGLKLELDRRAQRERAQSVEHEHGGRVSIGR